MPEYRKYMTRSLAVLDCQCWDRGERIGLPKISGGAAYFAPFFVCAPGRGVSAYYNYSDPDQDPEPIVKYFTTHPDRFQQELQVYHDVCDQLTKLSEEAQPDRVSIRGLFDGIVEMWPRLAMIMILAEPHESRGDESIAKQALAARHETDGVLYTAGCSLLEVARRFVPEDRRDDVEYMTIEEILSESGRDYEKVRERRDGYIYFKDEIYKPDAFYERYPDIRIMDTSARQQEVCGTTACGGTARGRVARIMESSQIDRVEQGDILVAPMTTPDLLAAMKRSAAFVTDEGGVTCHAAIVSREMGKPCVIGTQYATQVLQDGDEVEVNADEGIVRRIDTE